MILFELFAFTEVFVFSSFLFLLDQTIFFALNFMFFYRFPSFHGSSLYFAFFCFEKKTWVKLIGPVFFMGGIMYSWNRSYAWRKKKTWVRLIGQVFFIGRIMVLCKFSSNLIHIKPIAYSNVVWKVSIVRC